MQGWTLVQALLGLKQYPWMGSERKRAVMEGV
jgi:hypothetical protein